MKAHQQLAPCGSRFNLLSQILSFFVSKFSGLIRRNVDEAQPCAEHVFHYYYSECYDIIATGRGTSNITPQTFKLALLICCATINLSHPITQLYALQLTSC